MVRRAKKCKGKSKNGKAFKQQERAKPVSVRHYLELIDSNLKRKRKRVGRFRILPFTFTLLPYMQLVWVSSLGFLQFTLRSVYLLDGGNSLCWELFCSYWIFIYCFLINSIVSFLIKRKRRKRSIYFLCQVLFYRTKQATPITFYRFQ